MSSLLFFVMKSLTILTLKTFSWKLFNSYEPKRFTIINTWISTELIKFPLYILETLLLMEICKNKKQTDSIHTSYDHTHCVPPKRLTQRPTSTSSWVVYISLRQVLMWGTILRSTSLLKIIPGPPMQKFSPGSRASLPNSSAMPRPVWPR